MKNKKIQKILSTILSLSVMASLISVTPVAHAASTELYSDPDVYIKDFFHQAQALGTETRQGLAYDSMLNLLVDSEGNPELATYTTASGWDVSGGGYTTGKNSGGSFTLTGDSTTSPVTMTKDVPDVSTGMVKWEVTVRLYDTTMTTFVGLHSSTAKNVARIRFKAGDISYICAENAQGISIGKYSEKGTENRVSITSYINLNDSKVTVYINGAKIGEDWSILSGCDIDQAKITTLRGTTGAIKIEEFKVIKDYILHEDFELVEYTKEWQAAVSAENNLYGVAKLNAGDMISTDISNGNVATDEAVELQYRFNATEAVDTKIMDIQADRVYDNIIDTDLNGFNENSYLGPESLYLYEYSAVSDVTAVDGTSLKITGPTTTEDTYTTQSYNKHRLFDLDIPYDEITGEKYKLSFNLKKSSDLILKQKDNNGVYSDEELTHCRVYVTAYYTNSAGEDGGVTLRDNYRSTPRFSKSSDWQTSNYTFKLSKSIIDEKVLAAAGEGATVNRIRIRVDANTGYGTRILSGNFWLDNISFAEVKDGDSAMSLHLTNDGKINLVADGTANEVGTYRPNIWQNVRITYDIAAKTAKVRHNHLTETADIPVNNTVALEDLVFTNNTDTATITVDDVTVKKVYDEPSDYVPAPVVPADDGYYSSLLSCALWTETGGRGWDAISGFDERSPILGFYDEGKPEVSDWEIKYMVEHGIDSQVFCWFESDINNNGGAIPAFKDAKYSNYLDYSLMWTNTGSNLVAGSGNDTGFKEVFRNTYVPYWIDNYFKDDNYTKIDGKPVLYIFSGGDLLNYLGDYDGTAEQKVAGVLEEFAYLEEQCIAAGLNGIKIFVNQADGVINGEQAVGAFTYGYQEHSPDAIDLKWKDADGNDVTTLATNINLPVLSLRHNTEAWNGIPNQYTTPAEFEKICEVTKDRVDNWNYDAMYSEIMGDASQKLLVIGNWNELGEGHFMMPTKTFGFSYLDAFRGVFSSGAGSHTDVEPTESQLSRINKWYDQTRTRRDGSNVASSDKKGNIVKLWDFTDTDTISSLPSYITSGRSLSDGSTLGFGHMSGTLKATEGVGLQGTTTNGHAFVYIEFDETIDLDATGIDTVYIRGNQNVDFSVVLIRTPNVADDDWSTGVTYYTNYSEDPIVEQTVYMGDHEEWKGALRGLFVRIPVMQGDSFTIEAIGLMKNNFFEKDGELVTDGSFEDGEIQYTTDLQTEVQHYDFNRGAESLKVTGNGTINIPVSAVNTSGAYIFECYAKLPFGDTTESTVSAHLSYKVDGVAYTTDSLTTSFMDGDFAKLSGEFEIKEAGVVSDVTICIENAGGSVYYLDDVSLRRFDSKYASSDNITNYIRDGIVLEFNEDVIVDGATAVCGDETLTVTKSAENTVLVSLPETAVGKDTIVLSGVKTAAASESAGVILIDIYSGIDGVEEIYCTTDGIDVTEVEFASHKGEKIEGYIQVDNNSTTEVTGNVISSFYNGNELLNVIFRPFTAKGNAPAAVDFTFEVPSEYTDYKVFVWSDDYEPLLKGGE